MAIKNIHSQVSSLKSSMFLLILLKVKRFITERFIKMIFTQWVYAHLGSGVAWEMDSLTNLPPVWFYRWQSYPPVGICPWYIYLHRHKSTPLVKRNLLFINSNTEYFWAYLDHTRVILRQIVLIPIHTHIWKNRAGLYRLCLLPNPYYGLNIIKICLNN